MTDTDEKFFAQRPNRLYLRVETPHIKYCKYDFELEEMYNILEESFDKSDDNGGTISLSVEKPGYTYIREIAISITGKNEYRIFTRTSDSSMSWLYWWDPNKEEYTGKIIDDSDCPIDKRTIVNNIKYAQILFYELYKYGALSDNAMMNFRSLLNNKPPYYLVPKELL